MLLIKITRHFGKPLHIHLSINHLLLLNVIIPQFFVLNFYFSACSWLIITPSSCINLNSSFVLIIFIDFEIFSLLHCFLNFSFQSNGMRRVHLLILTLAPKIPCKNSRWVINCRSTPNLAWGLRRWFIGQKKKTGVSDDHFRAEPENEWFDIE